MLCALSHVSEICKFDWPSKVDELSLFVGVLRSDCVCQCMPDWVSILGMVVYEGFRN